MKGESSEKSYFMNKNKEIFDIEYVFSYIPLRHRGIKFPLVYRKIAKW